MRRTVRGLLAAVLLAGVVVLLPQAVEAGGDSIAYTCSETSSTGLVPDFAAELSITAPTAPATAKVFQPITWVFDIAEPALSPPLSVNLHYLRVRIPRPADLANASARAVAAAGETPNPPLSAVSVTMAPSEVVVQLPATPGTSNRIRAWADDDPLRTVDNGTDHRTGTGLSYPSNLLRGGDDVILPRIEVVATPTPPTGGSPVEWVAPTIESMVTITTDEPHDVAITCTPDGVTPPTVVSTAISTTRQTCDGKPVTVQLGYNTPTGANNVIQGTQGPDSTNGLAGNDRFCGLGGIDTFRGGPGNDRALGGAGNDKLFGDAGDDRLQGDAGTDTLNGGAGRDNLIGGTQRDTCIGGTQQDTATTCEVRQGIP